LILMAALNNWDFRPGNAAVLRVPAADAPGDNNGHAEDWYVVSDLGTAFGRMSDRRSRWKLAHYQSDPPFVVAHGANMVQLNLSVDGGEPLQVPKEHAAWFSDLASGVSDAQLRQAFAAAGATDAEAAGFSARFLEKLAMVRAVSGR
jgi:hypothetical protein